MTDERVKILFTRSIKIALRLLRILCMRLQHQRQIVSAIQESAANKNDFRC